MSHASRQRWKHDGVRVVAADQLDPNTAQTPGMDRKAAINFARVGAQKLWAGTVHIHPDAKTGAHHHGPSRASSTSSAAARACAGARRSSSPPRPGRATSSTCRRTCRTRRSTPAATETLECVLVPQRRRGGRGQPRHRAGREARDGALDRPDPSARLTHDRPSSSRSSTSRSRSPAAARTRRSATRSSLARALRAARLRALLAQRAPRPADDRRQRARDPDGGDRRAHVDASASAAPASCCRTTAR